MSVLKHQKITELASTPIGIDGGETLDAAALLMGQRHVGSLVVEIDGHPAAIVRRQGIERMKSPCPVVRPKAPRELRFHPCARSPRCRC